MAKNWAICIGINEYEALTPLNYARNDALQMHKFLTEEAGFDRVLVFASRTQRYPSRANLRRAIRQLVKDAKMSAGDNFWFFFSGHGMRHNGQDYLMPVDGDRDDIVETAIRVDFVTDTLRECGADNIVLLLDACRNQADKGGEGIGRQTAAEAQQTGVISIFSCSPNEYSYEIESLQQGVFTRALLDGLGLQGRCATVERLNQYLSHRVPELIRLHRSEKDRQTPYTIAEPITKSHLILLPKYATRADIALLKKDALLAEIKKNWPLAWQLWIRVNAAALGTDLDAIEAFRRIPKAPSSGEEEGREITVQPLPSGSKGDSEPEIEVLGEEDASLLAFSFEVVTVNKRGKIARREAREARYFREDCNGVPLEMVAIPGGNFLMGSPETEEDRINTESPQHRVTIQPFYLGKTAVTQAQWKAVAALPKVKIDLEPDPSRFKGANRPVEKVSWWKAEEFCKRLSQKTGKEYRLPSEAEWEYACRAGTTTPFHFGETITPELVNYNGYYPYGNAPKGKYRKETVEIGSLLPNGFGLFEMHGNVWEWCADHWHKNYQGAPNDGAIWLSSDESNRRLLRGGSWYYDSGYCRSTFRNRNDPNCSLNYIGFRVVVSPRTS